MVTILLVDDDANLLFLVEEYLRSVFPDPHFEITVADNGKDGLEKFKKLNPDIIVSDFRMPGMDGLEMFERILALCGEENVPGFILTSGYDKFAIKRRLCEYPAVSFLPKPYELLTLARIIFAKLVGKEGG
ncbi:MAG: response regulator [Candidatus Pacebacteria bacterium]|nr:response regulator [Candidatus Paceibacterota bacterium]MDR3582862.1 response regulator [Candidatus Paceibacterota bacterium]